MYVDAEWGPGSANKAAARCCRHAGHLTGLPSINTSRNVYVRCSKHCDRPRSAAADGVIRPRATRRLSTFSCDQKSSNKVVRLDRAASASERESVSGDPRQAGISVVDRDELTLFRFLISPNSEYCLRSSPYITGLLTPARSSLLRLQKDSSVHQRRRSRSAQFAQPLRLLNGEKGLPASAHSAMDAGCWPRSGRETAASCTVRAASVRW